MANSTTWQRRGQRKSALGAGQSQLQFQPGPFGASRSSDTGRGKSLTSGWLPDTFVTVSAEWSEYAVLLKGPAPDIAALRLSCFTRSRAYHFPRRTLNSDGDSHFAVLSRAHLPGDFTHRRQRGHDCISLRRRLLSAFRSAPKSYPPPSTQNVAPPPRLHRKAPARLCPTRGNRVANMPSRATVVSANSSRPLSRASRRRTAG